MLEFIGKFHPLLVHLPIGIIILAILLKVMSLFQRWKSADQNLTLILAIGFLMSVATCISGYFLSQSGGYDEQMVGRHQWAGIAMTVFCGVCVIIFSRSQEIKLQWIYWVVLGILITITGHFGGVLTHGENYLTFAQEKKRPVITDIESAFVFEDLVLPTFEEKCFRCHSNQKQKGELNLETQESILEGGENGKVLIAGNPEESELFSRILLDELHEDHMPPKGKPQLSEDEVHLLKWWIKQDYTFDKSVAEMEPSAEIMEVLKRFENKEERVFETNIPEGQVASAPMAVLEKMNDKNIVALPVGNNSNYLNVNYLYRKDIPEEEFRFLEEVKDQVVWLKLSETNFSDEHAELLSQLQNLVVLHLDNSAISDNTLKHLNNLKELKILNLTGTKVSAKGLGYLEGLHKLNSIYIANTDISNEELVNEEYVFLDKLVFGGFEEIFVTEKPLDTLSKNE